MGMGIIDAKLFKNGSINRSALEENIPNVNELNALLTGFSKETIIYDHPHKLFGDAAIIDISGPLSATAASKDSGIIAGNYLLEGSQGGTQTMSNDSPHWIKHMIDFKGRIVIGGSCNLGAGVWAVDHDGNNMELKQLIPHKISVWDMTVFKNRLFVVYPYTPIKVTYTEDLETWHTITLPTNGNHYGKNIIKHNGRLYIFKATGWYYSSEDGLTWTFVPHDFGSGVSQIYSKSEYNGDIYIGTGTGTAKVVRIHDLDKERATISDLYVDPVSANYIRWLTVWRPNHINTDYLVWGTGGTGEEGGTAKLFAYDVSTDVTTEIYDFKNGNTNNSDNAIGVPLDNAGNPIGYDDRQIRYLQPFLNKVSGQNFLIVSTSDNHSYKRHLSGITYYKKVNGTLVEWSDADYKAWEGNGINTGYMGNIYMLTTKAKVNNPTIENDIIIGVVKHTEDSRVYSLAISPDTSGKDYLYAGTGGGNTYGRGLLYKIDWATILATAEFISMGITTPPKISYTPINGTFYKSIILTGSYFFKKVLPNRVRTYEYVFEYSLKTGTVSADASVSVLFEVDTDGAYRKLTHKLDTNTLVLVDFSGDTLWESPVLDDNNLYFSDFDEHTLEAGDPPTMPNAYALRINKTDNSIEYSLYRSMSALNPFQTLLYRKSEPWNAGRSHLDNLKQVGFFINSTNIVFRRTYLADPVGISSDPEDPNKDFQIIGVPPTITTDKLPVAAKGRPYKSGALTYTGGTPPYTWEIIGDMPPGMTIDSKTGEIHSLGKDGPAEAGVW